MDGAEQAEATSTSPTVGGFDAFFATSEPRLRAALVTAFGGELGRDATAVALQHAWEHRDRVLAMENPVGFLYRVGQRWATREARRARRRFVIDRPADTTPGFEPALHDALARLPLRQRQVVVLAVGYGLTHAETAEVLGIGRSSVQNHVERGLRRLRQEIGEDR